MLCLELDEFKSENIFYKNTIKNSIITNGTFIYLNYISHHFSFNSIYIILRKKFGVFSKDVLNKIKSIEHELLKFSDKIKQYKFCQHLNTEEDFVILKITGIWESVKYCGVTFKIIHPQNNVENKTN